MTDRLSRLGLFGWLGVVIGIFMPIISALIYPTYVHRMPSPGLEWTRLMELPFVACELLVIHIASNKGMRDKTLWLSLPRDVQAAAIVLLVGLSVSSIFVSKNPAASVALSLVTIIHLRFALAVYHLARVNGSRDLRLFVPLLGVGLAALGVLTVWRFSFPPPAAEVFGGKIEWFAALPGFINVRHFGSWTGAIAAGLMVMLLYRQQPSKAAWPSFLYFLATTLTIWSGTRAAVLAAVVVGLIFLFSLRRFPAAEAIGRVAALTFAAGLAAISLPAPGPEFYLFVPADMATTDSISGHRFSLWTATFAKWLQAPVFGWGSGSVFWEVYIGWTHTQPHNVVLQFLISWGLVGAAGGLWLLARAIGAVHRRGVMDDALRPLTGTLYSLLFMSLLEGMLHYPRFIMLIMVGFAAIMARQNMQSELEHSSGAAAPLAQRI